MKLLPTLLLGLLALSHNGLGASRPNIIFILCDDLGYGDVGVFYQNGRAMQQDRHIPFFTTPHIDTLARDGAQLTQHYAGAPVCAPSRGSLLTGLTQGHADIRDNQFDKELADRHTLGSVLQEAGYATAAIGKWGLQGKADGSPPVPGESSSEMEGGTAQSWPAYPTRRGFDFYFGYVRHRDGHFHYPHEDEKELWDNDHEISADLDLCYTTDLFTARAKKWITEQRTASPDQPFFLYLAYDTPHARLQNPPSAYPTGGGLAGGVQWTGQPHAMINTARGEYDGWMHPDYAQATWNDDGDSQTPEKPWPDVQKRYANGVRRIDDAVGDLLQLLADLGVAENTLVVFTSDNGPSSESYLPERYTPEFFNGFGPFDGIKRDTWEGGLREPTLVRWPARIPAGQRDTHPSGQWDWLATFVDLAGLPPPAASDGVSLAPALTGVGEQRPSTIYSEYFNANRTPRYAEFATNRRGRVRGQMQVVLVDDYKGVRYDVKASTDLFEIYDLARDPGERNNLALSGELAGIQARMQARALQSRRPDVFAPRPYDEALVPARTEVPSGKPGLTCSYFVGSWPWIPDFRTLEPTWRRTVDQVALPRGMGRALAPSFGVAFTGSVLIPADGNYTFAVETNDDAMLFIHDCRVLAEPHPGATGPVTGSMRLAAGWHPLRLYYRQLADEPGLTFTVHDSSGQPLALDPTTLRQE